MRGSLSSEIGRGSGTAAIITHRSRRREASPGRLTIQKTPEKLPRRAVRPRRCSAQPLPIGGELGEEDRFDPLDGRALATNGVRRLRLHRADDDEVEPQVPLGIEACPDLDALPVGDVFTTLDDREGDAVSLASTVRVRDSLPLHGGVDTSRRPRPCELQRNAAATALRVDTGFE